MTMRAKLYQTAALMCLVATLPFGLQAAGPAKNLPVTSAIFDTDGWGAASQIQNDDQGAYTNSKSVQSVIQPIGDWVLDMNYSSLSTRGVYLDFSRNIDPNVPAPWSTPIGVKARLITQCPTYGISLLTLKPAGGVVECGLVVHFVYSGSSYRLAMNPAGVSGYDTDTVSVSCTGVNTSEVCNQWNIAGAGSGSTGKLLLSTTVKGKTVWVDKGNYEFAFSITVSNP